MKVLWTVKVWSKTQDLRQKIFLKRLVLWKQLIQKTNQEEYGALKQMYVLKISKILQMHNVIKQSAIS